ncbi:MAG: response regulator [Suipraeoptans sp.]
MFKLLIVDDEHIIRQGLSMIPWHEHDIEVVAVLKNGIEVEEWINNNEADILLTDIRMPGLSGIELAKIALENFPLIKVILLSGHGEFTYAQEAIKFGVFEYILKSSTPTEILDCVKRACEMQIKEKAKKSKMEKLEEEIKDYSMLIRPSEVILNNQEEQISKILQYIYKNYNMELTLSVLAERYHFTTVYLSRYIKRETGYTFVEILTSIRMYYAAKYLKETKLKNGEICEKIGIKDERYFGQVFKKRYGLTPYEYRKIGESAVTPFLKFLEEIQ